MEKSKYSMRFRHLTITDLTYGYELKEAVALLEKGFNYSNFNLKDLINMIETHKFLCDYDLLNDEGKKLLDPYIKEKKNIESTVGRYFNCINSTGILNDFENIRNDKDLNLSEYFSSFVKYKSFKKLTSEEFVQCIKNYYFHLNMVLRVKEFVEHFPDEICQLMKETPNAIELLICCYDLADENNDSKIRYYFPLKIKDITSELIDNYLSFEHKHLNYLEALEAHRDSDQTYRISRKQRIQIRHMIADEKTKLFSSGTVVNMGFVVSITPNQKEPIRYDRTPDNSYNISFSLDFLKSDLSNEGIIKRFFWLVELVDKQSRITGIYKPSNESTLSQLFYTKKQNEYGSYNFEYMQNIRNTMFLAYYEFLLRQEIDYADVLNWFINEFLNSKLPSLNFKSEIIHVDDDLSNCERIYNVIPDIFKQYKIFVEEGELTEELIAVSTDAFKVDSVPSLVKDKYYEVIKNSELSTIFNILFNDQCSLNYIDDIRSANTFFDLLNTNLVKKSDYKHTYNNEYIDYLIEKDILKEDKDGVLLFTDPLKLVIIKDLYKNGFIVYRRLTPDAQKVLDDLKSLGYLKATNGLFSSSEADYISFHLDNAKFSNALALRNKYEHSKGMHMSKEENRSDYISGLRLMTEIVAKIEEDIDEYMLNNNHC